RKPTTSQPSLSAASTTARKTALSPGQSPPLVRIPMRGFILTTSRSGGLQPAVPRGDTTNPLAHLRNGSIRGISLDQPSAPQPPIDIIVDSRVPSTLHILLPDDTYSAPLP